MDANSIAADVFGVDYAKLMLGQATRRVNLRLYMHDQGEYEGSSIVAVAGVMTGEIPKDKSYAHLWIGEAYFKPTFIGIDRERKMRGVGLAGAVTGGGLHIPTYEPLEDYR